MSGRKREVMARSECPCCTSAAVPLYYAKPGGRGRLGVHSPGHETLIEGKPTCAGSRKYMVPRSYGYENEMVYVAGWRAETAADRRRQS